MKKSLFGTLGLALALASSASADTLLSNFPSDTGGINYNIFGSQNTTSEFLYGITLGPQSYQLTSMTARLSGHVTFNALQMRLYADNGGQPGSDLGATFNTIALSGISNIQDAVFSPTNSVILNANTSYWFAVHAAPGQGTDSQFGYTYRAHGSATNTFATGSGASHLGYRWGYIPNQDSASSARWLYQVDGTPIVASSSAPEPGPLVFLTLGSTVIFLARRRRRANV